MRRPGGAFVLFVAAVCLVLAGGDAMSDDAAPAPVVWPDRLEGHGGPVKSVTLSRDGTTALSTSFDYSVILWRLEAGAGEVVHRLIGHEAATNDARFVGDERAVSVGDDGAVILWNLEDGEMLARIDTGDEKMLAVSVSPDARFAVTASWDRTARVYGIGEASLTELAILEGHRGNVNAAAFSMDGTSVYTASYDGGIRVYDRAGGAFRREIHSHGWGVNVMRVLAGGSQIAFGATDGVVAVVDIASGAIVKQLASHQRPVLSLALSPDGTRLASGGGDGRIRVYATDAWELLEEYENPYGPVWGLALTGDNQVAFYSGLDDHVNAWQISPRMPFDPVASDFPRRFQVAADGDPGERQFARKCSVCHTLTPDDGNRAGPTLYGVFGRRVGTVPGYPYSDALRRLDLVWSEQTISDLFDHGPDVVTPGSKMPIQRLKSAEERDALVSFLKRATAPDRALPEGGPGERKEQEQ
ncbi:c-type cytochrome [Stappia sp.]|uniref:c-type cytochrome n=1 Tax=Stappia sp. TaxID=1870903 RepID=UPI003A9A0B71